MRENIKIQQIINNHACPSPTRIKKEKSWAIWYFFSQKILYIVDATWLLLNSSLFPNIYMSYDCARIPKEDLEDALLNWDEKIYGKTLYQISITDPDCALTLY
jgi:hypothetical protein